MAADRVPALTAAKAVFDHIDFLAGWIHSQAKANQFRVPKRVTLSGGLECVDIPLCQLVLGHATKLWLPFGYQKLYQIRPFQETKNKNN